MAALPTDQETHQNFATLPPFPSNIPTAPLLKISLSNLLQKNASEEQKLYSACRDLGFFYLDLQSPPSTAPPDTGSAGPGSALLSTSSQLFTLGQEIFALPLEEKLQYDLSSQNSYFGYKGYGAGVIDSNGTRDRVEFWNISKDDILHHSSSPLPHPSILRAAETRATIAKFMTSSHEIVTVILGILNANLGLPQGTLESLHRLEAESGDQVRWVKSPPQPRNDRAVALGEHTDFGSVTVLFNRLGGLQVLISSESSQGGGWKYVRPLQGCCVVNLGDALVKFTRGVLRSNIHRVINPPGAQEGETRYSLVYFARPEDSVVLKALKGSKVVGARREEGEEAEEEEGITAKEWILRRALSRRTGGDFKKSLGTESERGGA